MFFKNYVADPAREGSLPAGSIQSVHVDTGGRLWIGTSAGGLARYDAARDRFRKIRARFPQEVKLDLSGALRVKHHGRELEILANGNSEVLLAELKAHSPEELKTESLTLEEGAIGAWRTSGC